MEKDTPATRKNAPQTPTPRSNSQDRRESFDGPQAPSNTTSQVQPQAILLPLLPPTRTQRIS